MKMYGIIEDALEKEYEFLKALKKTEKKEILLYRHLKQEKCIVVKRFSGECEVYNRLHSIRQQNLPIVYQVASEGEKIIVLEEYIKGITVADVLETGLYTEQGMARLVLSILDGLETLHKHGIIHRDIKPGNIVVSDTGVVKLIDFDAARIYKPYEKTDTIPLGTDGYAAPEQYGLTQSDPRSDIYAIGVLMNVVLTGKHPSQQMWKGKSEKVIKKCIQVDREDRYRSADDLKKRLKKYA